MRNLIYCFVLLIAANAITANPCAKPPEVDPRSCCSFPMPLPEALVADCVGKFGEQSKRVMQSIMTGGPPRGACVAECLSNTTGVISGVEVNVELLVAGFKMAADGMPEWDPVIEAGIPECAAMVKSLEGEFEKAAKLPPLDPADPICHAGPGFMFFCTVKTLFQSCPAKYYKASPQCDALKKYADTCPLGF
ncbi:general odorant-binding protein 66-like [Phlebotomus argentipes]|uniref:general odorant-binding protein 66-like n=1 Tax=Phlebotomus argentipes TaxID=94469 RepID=UPI0028936350|nr:general odorant-binding protein 66-like [Phlebotomus argentipes]